MAHVSDASASVEFGRYTVEPHRRELLADGRPVKLGGRAFDLLMALIDASGAVVSKDVLLDRVWPGRIVEENRLQNQVSALRRAFGADQDLIRTVAGRGYKFTGDIRARSAARLVAEVPPATPVPPDSPTNLPGRFSELIGRDTELRKILDLVAAHRLVTLTGIGGIGKTALVIEAARHLLPEFADGIWIAELGPLSDPDLVSVTVATALGLELAGGAMSPERVAKALSSKRLLLVLDNCEHVINAASSMAEALLRAGPSGRVMATSREPLRVPGESMYRVPPLPVPAENTQDLDEVLRHGAVRLLVARARAADPHLLLDQNTAVAAAGICRRLDGIPLAIELAAARAATLGLEGVASRLDDQFKILTGGYRTALPRHQTLRATIDWSYELLSEPERMVLCRLAIFPGGFALDAASDVAAGAEIAALDAIEYITSLVSKSLVGADISGGSQRFRLLETTRAYALEKLAERGEFELAARRHAEFCRQLFERAEAEWEARPTAEWLADYGWQIAGVRAALDWAFSNGGDPEAGVALAVAAVPLWVQLSLMDECRGRVERALSSIRSGAGRDTRREMQLCAALGVSLTYTKGSGPETGAAWEKALQIAERLNNTDYQLRALHGLWLYNTISGEFRTALGLAQRFSALAAETTDPFDRLIGDRLIGVILHYMGDHTDARRHTERMLASYVPPVHRSHTIRFQYDQGVLARGILARILWLQGFADQAMSLAQSNVEGARATGHAISLCYALAQAACPVAFWVGDLAAAENSVAMLLEHSEKHALPVWQAWGRSLYGVLLIERGEVARGLPVLKSALDELAEARSTLPYMVFQGELAEVLGRVGQVEQGVALIEQAIERCERSEERWSIPELIRIKGQLLLLDNAASVAGTAQDQFQHAIDWARRQGALSWELRGATSLARLWCNQGRSEAAYKLLAPVYDQFTEGVETADLKAARALIDDLRASKPRQVS
jgi:predicted ATPase/DNA-binding winged helix-turn-helix (wHTH) protein